MNIKGLTRGKLSYHEDILNSSPNSKPASKQGSKSAFKKLSFVKSAVRASEYPKLLQTNGRPMVEIAVGGRSNVGKSSLLNNLFHCKIVKTSATPGKTQLLNFFTADDNVAFADLPGYGFASVPIDIRKKWGPMVQNYLEKRETLQLILFLFDIRRTPNEEDIQLIRWAEHYNKEIWLILTKVDKVTNNEKKSNSQKIIEAFSSPTIPLFHYSSTKEVGRYELIKALQTWMTKTDAI